MAAGEEIGAFLGNFGTGFGTLFNGIVGSKQEIQTEKAATEPKNNTGKIVVIALVGITLIVVTVLVIKSNKTAA